MKIMFTVQGEGRGHMTQAIAMSEMLQRRGHQIVAVVAGANQTRSLPAFFEQGFSLPLRRIASPGFSLKKHPSLSLVRPFTNIFPHLPAFKKSLGILPE